MHCRFRLGPPHPQRMTGMRCAVRLAPSRHHTQSIPRLHQPDPSGSRHTLWRARSASAPQGTLRKGHLSQRSPWGMARTLRHWHPGGSRHRSERMCLRLPHSLQRMECRQSRPCSAPSRLHTWSMCRLTLPPLQCRRRTMCGPHAAQSQPGKPHKLRRSSHRECAPARDSHSRHMPSCRHSAAAPEDSPSIQSHPHCALRLQSTRTSRSRQHPMQEAQSRPPDRAAALRGCRQGMRRRPTSTGQSRTASSSCDLRPPPTRHRMSRMPHRPC